MKKWLPVAAAAAFLGLLAWRYFGPSAYPTHALINFDTPTGRKVVAFGDALTSGQGASTETASYPAQLSALLGVEVVNLGMKDETTASALKRVAEVKAHEPDFVLVTLGSSDLAKQVELSETINNLEKIFRQLQDMGAGVVYLSINPPMVGDNWSMAIRDVVRSSGVLWVDDVMKDLWGDPALMADAMHPNDEGYAKIAVRIENAMRQVSDF